MGEPRAWYAVNLDLAVVGVLVVGGGAVALRKLRGLPLGAGRVRVVAPRVSAEVRTLARRRKADVVERGVRAADLAGRALVFCCADDPAVNARVARAARNRGLWVCQAADPGQGNLSVPAVARAGGLRLAVSTDGASPALAKALKARLAGELRASDLAWVLGRLRAGRAALRRDPAAKDRLLLRLTRPRVLERILAPRSPARRRALSRLLNP